MRPSSPTRRRATATRGCPGAATTPPTCSSGRHRTSRGCRTSTRSSAGSTGCGTPAASLSSGWPAMSPCAATAPASTARTRSPSAWPRLAPAWRSARPDLDQLVEGAAVVERERRRVDRPGGGRHDLVARRRVGLRAQRRVLPGPPRAALRLRRSGHRLAQRGHEHRAAAPAVAGAAVAAREGLAHLAVQHVAQVLLHVAPPAVEEERLAERGELVGDVADDLGAEDGL